MFRNTGSKIAFIGISIILLVAGCKKPGDKFSDTPEIDFVSFEVNDDSSALLTISFKDGDGDIGLSDSDTTGPFHDTMRYYNNLLIYKLVKDDKKGWIYLTNLAGDTSVNHSRIPLIEANGKDKSLQGEIDVFIQSPYFSLVNKNSDTMKYEIQLVDRALNLSNVLETPEIIR